MRYRIVCDSIRHLCRWQLNAQYKYFCDYVFSKLLLMFECVYSSFCCFWHSRFYHSRENCWQRPEFCFRNCALNIEILRKWNDHDEWRQRRYKSHIVRHGGWRWSNHAADTTSLQHKRTCAFGFTKGYYVQEHQRWWRKEVVLNLCRTNYFIFSVDRLIVKVVGVGVVRGTASRKLLTVLDINGWTWPFSWHDGKVWIVYVG